MHHITGIFGNQIVFSSLKDTILPDKPIQFIDGFANSIDSATAFGTTGKKPREEGKTGFD